MLTQKENSRNSKIVKLKERTIKCKKTECLYAEKDSPRCELRIVDVESIRHRNLTI